MEVFRRRGSSVLASIQFRGRYSYQKVEFHPPPIFDQVNSVPNISTERSEEASAASMRAQRTRERSELLTVRGFGGGTVSPPTGSRGGNPENFGYLFLFLANLLESEGSKWEWEYRMPVSI